MTSTVSYWFASVNIKYCHDFAVIQVLCKFLLIGTSGLDALTSL